MTSFKKIKKLRLASGVALQAMAMVAGGVSAGLLVASPAVAQDYTNVTASGRVLGTNGKAISGATVIITSNDQGFSRTVTTDNSGAFRVPQLPIGSYTFKIEADGFDAYVSSDIQISTDSAANQFALAPLGGADGEIVVTAGRLKVVDFERTTVGAVVDVGEIASRVPVARDLTSIIKLAPGTAQGDSAFGNLASISGSSVAENAFYVNGLNITDFRKGLGSVTVPFEFYQTVEVKNGGFQAEYGRATGGVVNAVTKSGSNEWHAGALVTFEPDDLQANGQDVVNARNNNAPFVNNSADYRSRIDANIYASGPIIKDHLFFYALYNPRIVKAGDGVATAKRYDRQRTDSPFWGGKIDAVITDGQRLEFTYFDTSGSTITNSYNFDPTSNEITDYQTAQTYQYGGANYVGRYTGNFAEWLTISAAYGKNKSNDSTVSSDNSLPTVIDNRSGTAQNIGNPTSSIEIAKDTREFYRADVDLYFNALGSHHIRAGYDRENLSSFNTAEYTGGVVYQYYLAAADDDYAAPGTEYVAARIFRNGGLFKSKNEAFYVQDNWSLLDNRLQLQLGLRNDRFENRNVDGVVYYSSGDQLAPRLGFTLDAFGNGRTKVYGSFGRYFLPIASNTNIRLAGAELDYTRYNVLNGLNADKTPIIGAPLLFDGGSRCYDTGLPNCELVSDGEATPTEATVSKSLKPQSVDEYILGAEQRLGDRFKIGLYGTYRKLNRALEDAAIDLAVNNYCEEEGISGCSSTWSGFHQYVLINPGDSAAITLSDPVNGEAKLRTVEFTAEQLGYPKAKRTYKGLTFTFEREWDGKWSLAGSYTWSKNKGNYEGGVKSDNGQDDAGITTDFDQPGLVNGSYGYLPNDRRHNLKLYGAYQATKQLLLGANLQVTSPRRFGCIGRVPSSVDPYANLYGAAGWYCRVADGQIQATSPTTAPLTLTPRASAFKSDWLSELNVTASYDVKLGKLDSSIRVDVFNVFNSSSKLDFEERGTLSSGAPRNSYQLPTSFQRPRYVRLQYSIAF